MTPDLPPAPPETQPATMLVAQAPTAEPIAVDSHGYHYAIAGNTLLTPAVIVAIVEAADTPQKAVDALRLAYQRAGYPLVALRGEVSNKLVAVQVINGRITEFDVTPPSLAPYFAGLEGRDDIDRNTLIRKGALAEFYAAREGLRPSVNFAPAAEVGGTKLIATAQPIEGASPWNANLSFGNFGSRYSSRYLWQAAGAVRPGGGLELTANYGQGIPGLTSDSSGSTYKTAALGGSLVTPWGFYGLSLNRVSYAYGERVSQLAPVGEITFGSITGTQLLFADEVSRWTVNEVFTHTDNEIDVFEGTFRLTDQHYDLITLGTSFNTSFAVLGQNASATVTASVSRGLSQRKGTFLPDDIGVANPRFTQVVGSVNYQQSLPAGASVALAFSGQWADTILPQNQQWVVGGFGNLTAWLPAILVGDSGMLLRATAQSPPWQWKGVSVTGNALVDAGLVNTYYTPEGRPANRAASDAGLSVSGSLRGGTSATLAYAWPLAARNVELSTLNAAGRANLYFTLSQSF